MLRLFAMLLVLVTVGCRAEAIDAMARTSALVDQQFSVAYGDAAALCLEQSETRAAYDTCLEPWSAAADAVLVLRDTTLSLDATQGRRPLKAQACRWFRALSVVDALSPVDIPAAQAGLDSKWNRKC